MPLKAHSHADLPSKHIHVKKIPSHMQLEGMNAQVLLTSILNNAWHLKTK